VKADEKARGRYLGGKIPFCFRLGESGEVAALECEQQAIDDMAALWAQGKPSRAIADAVRGQGPQDQPRGRGGRLKGRGCCAGGEGDRAVHSALGANCRSLSHPFS
jgi:hypothetical protein